MNEWRTLSDDERADRMLKIHPMIRSKYKPTTIESEASYQFLLNSALHQLMTTKAKKAYKNKVLKSKEVHCVTIVWVPSRRVSSIYTRERTIVIPFHEAALNVCGPPEFNVFKFIISLIIGINIDLIRLWTKDSTHIHRDDGNTRVDVRQKGTIFYMSDIFPDDTCIDSDVYNVN